MAKIVDEQQKGIWKLTRRKICQEKSREIIIT